MVQACICPVLAQTAMDHSAAVNRNAKIGAGQKCPKFRARCSTHPMNVLCRPPRPVRPYLIWEELFLYHGGPSKNRYGTICCHSSPRREDIRYLSFTRPQKRRPHNLLPFILFTSRSAGQASNTIFNYEQPGRALPSCPLRSRTLRVSRNCRIVY